MRELKTTTKTTSQLVEIINDLCRNPDKYDREPFQILDNIYYVGNTWVGAFLIDTGEGLILVDTNFPEVMPILFKNIRKLGFEISDIKWVFISHGHWDHIGGVAEIQKLTDCVTYYPEGDRYLLEQKQRKDVAEFRIDHYYEYDKKIVCGNVTVTPVLTPGHTLGCTSLFVEVPYKGKTYIAGIHGGLGQNGLTQKELAEKNMPRDLPNRYLASLEKVREIPVDVFLPLHNAYYDIFALEKEDNGDHTIYIQPEDWKGIMDLRIQAIQKLMAGDK